MTDAPATATILTMPGIIPAVNPMVPNETLVQAMRETLARAESGELVGMAAAFMHGEGTASWCLAGNVGSFSLLGALKVAEDELMICTRSLE